MQNKNVIYTALTGGYDALNQPICVHEDYDYICFSNDFKEDYVGVWQIRKIPYQTENVQVLSRYPKMHPHILLKEYEISIYMDANIIIVDDCFYKEIDKVIEKDVVLAGVKHPENNCLYKEAYRVLKWRIDTDLWKILCQMTKIRLNGFPANNGLNEAGVIYRRHNNIQVIKQSEMWWNMVLKYSKRDQLTYAYSVWKNNIDFYYLLPEDISIGNYCGFQYINHKRKLHDDKLLKYKLLIFKVYYKYVLRLAYK